MENINYERVSPFLGSVIGALVSGENVKATKYISPKEIIRGTRKRFRNRIVRGNIEIILTIGRPNYVEREFIKLCKEAGELFPVKKVQVKPYVIKKKALKR